MRYKFSLILIFFVLSGTGASYFSERYQNKGTAVVEGEKNNVPKLPLADFMGISATEGREEAADDNKETITPSSSPPISSADKTGGENRSSCGDDFECYEKHYQDLVAGQGIVAAFVDLKAVYQNSQYVQSQCHPLTHVIGRSAASIYPDVAVAYIRGDSFCWSGYYHGVLEGVIDQIGYQQLVTELSGICKSLGERDQYSFDHYNCVHGLGHGVMAITNDELFQSLEICDNLTDSWERASCWSGAFMENVIIENTYHYSKYLRPEEPLYPCTAVDYTYKDTCYLMQTSYMLKVLNGDFAKVFSLCREADQGFERTCYQSLGRDASGRSVSNVAQTKSWCLLGQTLEQKENCVIGAVKDFISYFHDIIQARQLCDSFEDVSLKNICHDTATEYYKIF